MSLIFSETKLEKTSEGFNYLLSSYVDSVGTVNYKGIIENPNAILSHKPNNFEVV